MTIAIFYRHFPVSMGRYIQWGLKQLGHDVISIGPYSHGTIPWGDFKYPKHYWFPPDVELPDQPEYEEKAVFEALKTVRLKWDLFISAADTVFITGKLPCFHVLIGTDPHVIDYHAHLDNVDKYVSMQKFYSQPGDLWMPYGYDPELHQWFPDYPLSYNVVFCGLQYPHRLDALKRMSALGYKVWAGTGTIYDEYVRLYNSAPIAFNWSSKLDLPARFWEALAMRRLLVTNRVPDLEALEFKDGEDYIGFDTVEEAVDAVKIVMKKPELMETIASSGYKKVEPHTYANHARKMLAELLV